MNALPKNEIRKLLQPVGWKEIYHLVLATLFGVFAIGMVAIAASILNEPASVFTREPQQVLGGPFYAGSFSNLGGLIWFSCAAVLSFAAVLKPTNRGALILAAMLTWAMGVDDIFMLHDRVYPKLYLNELMVTGLYFLTIAVIIFRFFRQINRATLVGIALTVMFWGLSTLIDQFYNNPAGQLAEDGSKFTGVAVWAAAWIRQAYIDIAGLFSPRA